MATSAPGLSAKAQASLQPSLHPHSSLQAQGDVRGRGLGADNKSWNGRLEKGDTTASDVPHNNWAANDFQLNSTPGLHSPPASPSLAPTRPWNCAAGLRERQAALLEAGKAGRENPFGRDATRRVLNEVRLTALPSLPAGAVRQEQRRGLIRGHPVIVTLGNYPGPYGPFETKSSPAACRCRFLLHSTLSSFCRLRPSEQLPVLLGWAPPRFRQGLPGCPISEHNNSPLSEFRPK